MDLFKNLEVEKALQNGESAKIVHKMNVQLHGDEKAYKMLVDQMIWNIEQRARVNGQDVVIKDDDQ